MVRHCSISSTFTTVFRFNSIERVVPFVIVPSSLQCTMQRFYSKAIQFTRKLNFTRNCKSSKSCYSCNVTLDATLSPESRDMQSLCGRGCLYLLLLQFSTLHFVSSFLTLPHLILLLLLFRKINCSTQNFDYTTFKFHLPNVLQ